MTGGKRERGRWAEEGSQGTDKGGERSGERLTTLKVKLVCAAVDAPFFVSA